MTLAVVIIALIVALVLRERRIDALTALSMSRRRLAPNGIVIGGEGFTLGRTDAPAVLLLHGAGDTPQTLRYLGDFLHARGFHVEAPLLPGHGRTVREFARVRAEDLIASARQSLDALRSTHDWVGIIGLSMGGAIAVQLAASDDRLPALGLAAPYLSMPVRIRRAAQLSWLWGLITPIVNSAEGTSILDPDERAKNLAYGVFTAGALRALADVVRGADAALPRVIAPTLVLQSRQDNRISPGGAERAFDRLGAREKRIEWLTNTAHVITVDYGREHVFEALATWLEAHGASSLIR